MFREESPIMPLLRIAAMGCAYYWGKQEGKAEVTREQQDRKRDEEIAALKRQLNDLKR